jgi:hypothetical protein
MAYRDSPKVKKALIETNTMSDSVLALLKVEIKFWRCVFIADIGSSFRNESVIKTEGPHRF